MAQFLRGAIPTPRHKLQSIAPYRVLTAPLPQFAIVPPKLDMWGNNQYGDCVSAEEAFAKAWWSVYCGLPETFATAQEVINFARQHGWLNGATLTDPMDAMIRQGMSISGKMYQDGAYQNVDYSNELVLQSALDPTDGSGGCIKIGIDADALPSGAGNHQGWFATQRGNYRNEDHCVSLAGYGRADYLYDALKVALPAGLSPSTPGYLLYTWSTLGFVTHDWLMGTCQEAFVRNPGTPGQSPPSPTPSPDPGPTPAPPVPPAPVIHGTAHVAAQPISFQVPVGAFGGQTRTVQVTIPGQDAPVEVQVPTTADDLGRWRDVPPELRAKLTPAQWLALITQIIAIINGVLNPPTPAGH